MLHYVTDAMTGNRVAISSEHVIAVFSIPEGEHKDRTQINLTNGQILVEEMDYDIVSMLNAG